MPIFYQRTNTLKQVTGWSEWRHRRDFCVPKHDALNYVRYTSALIKPELCNREFRLCVADAHVSLTS